MVRSRSPSPEIPPHNSRCSSDSWDAGDDVPTRTVSGVSLLGLSPECDALFRMPSSEFSLSGSEADSDSQEAAEWRPPRLPRRLNDLFQGGVRSTTQASPTASSPASQVSSHRSGAHVPRGRRDRFHQRTNLDEGASHWSGVTTRLGGPFTTSLASASTSPADTVPSTPAASSCSSPHNTLVFQKHT